MPTDPLTTTARALARATARAAALRDYRWRETVPWWGMIDCSGFVCLADSRIRRGWWDDVDLRTVLSALRVRRMYARGGRPTVEWPDDPSDAFSRAHLYGAFPSDPLPRWRREVVEAEVRLRDTAETFGLRRVGVRLVVERVEDDRRSG